jgi:hypothetical protein
VTNHSENTAKTSEIRVLINIGSHFFDEKQIRSAVRFGKGTKIFLDNGEEIVVSVSYDRVADILSHISK